MIDRELIEQVTQEFLGLSDKALKSRILAKKAPREAVPTDAVASDVVPECDCEKPGCEHAQPSEDDNRRLMAHYATLPEE